MTAFVAAVVAAEAYYCFCCCCSACYCFANLLSPFGGEGFNFWMDEMIFLNYFFFFFFGVFLRLISQPHPLLTLSSLSLTHLPPVPLLFLSFRERKMGKDVGWSTVKKLFIIKYFLQGFWT